MIILEKVLIAALNNLDVSAKKVENGLIVRWFHFNGFSFMWKSLINWKNWTYKLNHVSSFAPCIMQDTDILFV